MRYKPLPIGIDRFPEMIEQGYYYVDKSLLIKELIDRGGEVTLFTRPRRFGKTLALSMVKTFFELDVDYEGAVKDNRHYFDGLRIMEAGEYYTNRMGKYPVISLTLKSAKQPDFHMAYESLKDEIVKEYERHRYVLESEALIESYKERYRAIMDRKADQIAYAKSIEFLSDCLKKYHRENVIILIDEYDVPLENAYFRGFYDRMVDFLRSLFESALKTNGNLRFAVITGCLRISRESIFTGLNNLKVVSVTQSTYAEYFGFTEPEVQAMLDFYDRDSCMSMAKKWYDGYLFGNVETYNPWSIINYTEQVAENPLTFPRPFWSNTSSNDIVRTLIERADIRTKQEIEALIEGESIEKKIHEDITYEDIGADQPRDHLWNFLFFTGYLKAAGERMEGNVHYIDMAIPNEEVRYIYKNTVLSWFDHQLRQKDLTVFYTELIQGKTDKVEETITAMLRAGISFYDSQEAFYHGFLMGLFSGMEDYYAVSNREAGDGRYDICLKSLDVEKPVILMELKTASSYAQMEPRSREALEQIALKHYHDGLVQDGYRKLLCYGLAFYRKNCRAALKEQELNP